MGEDGGESRRFGRGEEGRQREKKSANGAALSFVLVLCGLCRVAGFFMCNVFFFKVVVSCA